MYGKYGALRKEYLKEHKKWYYSFLILDGKLNAHLNTVDREAHEMVEQLVLKMKEEEGITEQLKARNPMLWVGKMNGLKACAEEIVFKKLICV